MTKTAARQLPIGQRIVWARRRKGISQEGLAAITGVSRRHLIRIEGGQVARPTERVIAAIARATEQQESFFDSEEDSMLHRAAEGLVSALTAELRKSVQAAQA